MQADFWDSTIFLGDGAEEVTAAAKPRPPEPFDPSRRISREILFPQGRPGGWLLFLVALCGLVLVQALRVHLA